jgi:outer membrane protein assembly factor BamD (BamD/ComL family)
MIKKVPLVFCPPAWYRNSMKLKYIALAVLMIVAVSCISTGPVEIPDGLTTAELIQRGQEASDRNRYNVSLQYYEAVLERFPYDIDNVIAAEYEIAFIHYKQKDYAQAKTDFNRLLAHFNTPDEELLPAQFKILSHIVLGKIAEIEAANQNNNRR